MRLFKSKGEMPLHNRSRGFKLIELVLIITLMGILAALTFTVFNVRTIPFKSAIEKLKHDIRHAQWEAMNRKIRHGVIFDPNAETYSVYQISPDNIIPDPLNPSVDFTVNYTTNKMFKNVGIVSVDINGTARIEFDGRGIPYDGNGDILAEQGRITLTHDGNTTTVTIEPSTGRVGN